MSNEISNVKWYKRKWFVWVMMVLFFPIGLALMWTNENFKKTTKIVTSVLLALLIFIGQIGDNDTTPTNSKEVETVSNEKTEEQKKAEELERQKQEELKAQKQKEAEAEAKRLAEEYNNRYNNNLKYDDLARNPEQHKGKYVSMRGKVIQVMKGSTYNQYRLAVNDNYDNVVLIEIQHSQLTNGNILEDDVINIKGQFAGEYSYQTVLGATLTVPAIVIESFSY